MALFTFLKISLMYGLIEDSCHFIPAITLNLLPHIVLFEVHKKNLTSRRHAVGKGRSILVAFLDTCGYSFLISHQNSKSNNFLKAYWKCRNK